MGTTNCERFFKRLNCTTRSCAGRSVAASPCAATLQAFRSIRRISSGALPRHSGRHSDDLESRAIPAFRSRKPFPCRRDLAAAALQVLARLWGDAPVSLLRDVAAGIGADVPFFLSGGTALGLGRGEEIYPLVDLPAHWVVIARPPYGVSTAEAYSWYDEDRAAGIRESRELQILPVPWPTRAAQMINDLEPPVVRRHPEIAGLKSALREAGAVAAAMSGSGSAVFGLFRGRTAAAKVLRPLRRGGVQAFLTRTVTRGEHERRGRPIARRV
jgi:hypothetical protein